MRVSVVLDRRSFLMGATGAVGVAAVAAGALPGGGWRLTLVPASDSPAAGWSATMDWDADHIFGTYPPYAHPIPYGRQIDALSVPFEPGGFD